MTNVTIRAFSDRDLLRVQEIAVAAWTPIFDEMRAQLGDELFKLSRPNPAANKCEQLQLHAKQHPEWFIIAEDAAGFIVGFATYHLVDSSKTGVIGNNAVDASCGLKGVGQAMYAELFRRFRESGMILAQVLTGLDDAHAPARRAYQRAGFEHGTESITYIKKL